MLKERESERESVCVCVCSCTEAEWPAVNSAVPFFPLRVFALCENWTRRQIPVCAPYIVANARLFLSGAFVLGIYWGGGKPPKTDTLVCRWLKNDITRRHFSSTFRQFWKWNVMPLFIPVLMFSTSNNICLLMSDFEGMIIPLLWKQLK